MKWLVLLAFLAYLPSYSYSNPITYGASGNAAQNGLNWVMSQVLPNAAGLSVNGVVYQYTAVKETEDDMIVYVQNENAEGNGYIFREVDDWSGLPGESINKLVSVNNIPIGAWGDGSIEVEGTGSVEDPNVIYTYKIDRCYDPQADPSCPGYVPPIEPPEIEAIDIYDALSDDAVREALDETDPELYDRDKKRQRKAEENSEQRLENALAATENALTLALLVTQDAMIQSMSRVEQLNPYYRADIPGGVYRETVSLPKTNIPDNKDGLRNGLAQQILHEKMVQSQYSK